MLQPDWSKGICMWKMGYTTFSFYIFTILLCPPEGMGRSRRWVQYRGNPWRRQSKLCASFRVQKFRNNLFPEGECNSCYTVKNSYFYLILAKRPWSDDEWIWACLKILYPRQRLVVVLPTHVKHHWHYLCETITVYCYFKMRGKQWTTWYDVHNTV